MKPLYEKYRPRRLAQIVGQGKAVAKVRTYGGSVGGQAFYITGKSGTGKTTLARCIARMIADDWFITEIDAGKVNQAFLDDIERQKTLYATGKGGRAWIINEAHGLSRAAIRGLLATLEPIPPHCVFVFTTTNDGMALFEDAQIDAGPLLSRCVPLALTSQGLAPVFARLVSRIASRERLNGQPAAAYLALANRVKGNCRAMLQAVQSGEMVNA